jgi:hypothetical protein
MTGYRSKVKMAQSRYEQEERDEYGTFTLKIDYETAEAVFQKILVQDYKDMKKEVARLQRRHEEEAFGLSNWDYEELRYNQTMLKGFERLLTYYLPRHEYQPLINEAVFDQDVEDEYELSLLRALKGLAPNE